MSKTAENRQQSGNERDTPAPLAPDPAETLAYIMDLLKSLRGMADGAKLHFLAYLLSLAMEEARDELRRRS